MLYALRKLNAQPKQSNWLALRVSYGMNGILLRSQDLPLLAGYLRYAPAVAPFCTSLFPFWHDTPMIAVLAQPLLQTGAHS